MDTAQSTSTPTSNGVSNAPIVLDDTDTTDLIGVDAPVKADAEPKTEEPAAAAPKEETAKPDPDDLVLELSRRNREAASKSKELDGLVAKHKQFAEILGLAKSDPYAFIERMAEAAGVDVDTAVEAYTVRKAGGKRELTAEERIARMEAEHQANEKREADARAEREKAEGDAAITRHVNGLKEFAKVSEDNFPLFNDDLEVNAQAAFDLMALSLDKGKSITYAAAVHQIETTLRADTERRAARIGFAKPTGSTASQPTTTQHPTAQSSAPPRQTQASAAPAETTQTIKSDEDIEAEWLNLFSNRR